jgi:outer membrane protein TolC
MLKKTNDHLPSAERFVYYQVSLWNLPSTAHFCLNLLYMGAVDGESLGQKSMVLNNWVSGVIRHASGWSANLLMAMLLCQIDASAQAPPASSVSFIPLHLRECTERVVAYNETLQMRSLEWLASQKRLKAAKGIFEPDFVGSIERDANLRKNTAEQEISLGTTVLDEKNTLYNGGLEFLTASGARFKVGYTMRDLVNNIQAKYYNISREFESFAGLNVVQPIMKNAGTQATLAGIRLAAGESELAFQEYRRQMCLILARAEAAYWDLYFAQELARIRTESVSAAEKLLQDNRVRVQTGKASELDVLQAEAGVSLRQAREKDALQKRFEGMNRLTILLSGSSASSSLQVEAIDVPSLREIDLNFGADMRTALELNPDYRSQVQQVAQEKIRIAYARNQMWPQLDLKASFGLNGLGTSIGSSMNDIESGGFPSWSVGFELRIPLTGGIKGRNELAAVKLRRQAALVGLKSVEVELANSMDTMIRRVNSTRDSVANYQKVVDFNQRLLATELARMEAGKSESRKVLEVEEYLSEAKSAALENLINNQKALIEWELIKGDLLKSRNYELTKAQLTARTVSLVNGLAPSGLKYDALHKEAKAEFDRKVSSSGTGLAADLIH